MFDKVRYSLSLLGSNELLQLFVALAVYHLLILFVLYMLVKGSMLLRMRALEKESEECKKNWANRDVSWKEKEDAPYPSPGEGNESFRSLCQSA